MLKGDSRPGPHVGSNEGGAKPTEEQSWWGVQAHQLFGAEMSKQMLEEFVGVALMVAFVLAYAFTDVTAVDAAVSEWLGNTPHHETETK